MLSKPDFMCHRIPEANQLVYIWRLQEGFDGSLLVAETGPYLMRVQQTALNHAQLTCAFDEPRHFEHGYLQANVQDLASLPVEVTLHILGVPALASQIPHGCDLADLQAIVPGFLSVEVHLGATHGLSDRGSARVTSDA
jgi:hypothetical protein